MIPKAGWLCLVLIGFSLSLMFLYVLLPSYLNWTRCPPDAFAAGSTGGGYVVLGLFLFPLPFGVWTGWLGALHMNAAHAPSSNPTISNRYVIPAAWLGAFALSLYVLMTRGSALECAAPDGIFARTSVLGEMRRTPWSDVKIVRAGCYHPGRGNGPPRARMILSLADGEELPFGLGPTIDEAKRNVDALRQVLRGSSYKVDISRVSGRCQGELYDLFMNWKFSLAK